MPAALQFEGLRFNRVTCVEPCVHNGIRHWRCRCDCGKEITSTAYDLKTGRVKSCGCYRKSIAASVGMKKRHGPGDAMFNNLFGEYGRRAKERSLQWNLSKEHARFLFSQPCYYCGCQPSQVRKPKPPLWGAFEFNGIDRLDNSKGYTADNSVPCCKFCNYAKRERSVAEFLSWIKQVHEHRDL